jgi:hypothetical protein
MTLLPKSRQSTAQTLPLFFLMPLGMPVKHFSQPILVISTPFGSVLIRRKIEKKPIQHYQEISLVRDR